MVTSPDQWAWSSLRFHFLGDDSVLPMDRLPSSHTPMRRGATRIVRAARESDPCFSASHSRMSPEVSPSDGSKEERERNGANQLTGIGQLTDVRKRKELHLSYPLGDVFDWC